MVYDFGSCSLNRRYFRTFAIVLDIKRIFRTSVGRSRYRNMFKNIWQQLCVLEPALLDLSVVLCTKTRFRSLSVVSFGHLSVALCTRRCFRTLQQFSVPKIVQSNFVSSSLYNTLHQDISKVVLYIRNSLRTFVNCSLYRNLFNTLFLKEILCTTTSRSKSIVNCSV